MKKHLFYSFLAVFSAVFLSCSNDDDAGAADMIGISNFSIISFDDDAFYEYRFNQEEQEGFSRNLTQEEGISRLAFFIRRIDGVFGFYAPGSATIKDFETEELTVVKDLGGNPGEDRITATNDNATLGLIFILPGTPDFFLRVINIMTATSYVLPLGVIDEDAQLYIEGDDIFVVSGENNSSRLIKIDRVNQAITGEIVINQIVSGLIYGENDDIYVFSNSGTYSQLAINDLSMLSQNSITFVPNSNLSSKLRGDVLYSQFEYPQPSEYAIGPAAYDLSTGNRTIIDIATIFEGYLAANDDTEIIQPVHFDFDTDNTTWIVAFQAQNDQEVGRYGYFVITEEGEIVQENPLERLPWSVVLYN